MTYYSHIILVFAIAIILVLASLFSFLETATVAVSEHRLKLLKDQHLWAKYAYKLKLQLNQVLIFSLFGNSLFNAIFTTLTTIVVAKLLVGIGSNFILPLTTLLIAFVIIVFSEALPKIIAVKSPLVILRLVSIPLYHVFVVSKPIIWLIDKMVVTITRALMINNHETTSLEEVKAIITDKRTPFTGTHRSILLNSIDLAAITIKEVLIPLRMVEAIDISGELEQIYKRIYTTHHTRIIVYEGKIDNIIGFIHAKDILSLAKNAFGKPQLYQILRPISFVSDFMPIIRQIHHAQKHRSRIFAVINEYGDISGIACLEDMLEMIFGDFTTESPQQKHLAIKNDQGQLIVDGTMLIRELNELFQLDIELAIDALTVNGLVLKTLNGIPNVGVCFRLNNLIFEVINVGSYWVERVKISIIKL